MKTIEEMRNELIEICDSVLPSKCGKACPVFFPCYAFSVHIPENMTEEEIKQVYEACREE